MNISYKISVRYRFSELILKLPILVVKEQQPAEMVY